MGCPFCRWWRSPSIRRCGWRPFRVSRVHPDELARGAVGKIGVGRKRIAAERAVRISRREPEADFKIIEQRYRHSVAQAIPEPVTVADCRIVRVMLFVATAEIAAEFEAGDPTRQAERLRSRLAGIFVSFFAQVVGLLLGEDAFLDQLVQ